MTVTFYMWILMVTVLCSLSPQLIGGDSVALGIDSLSHQPPGGNSVALG